ncbi:hypothetical protein C6503_17540 [Candidatus Poribacteria bacterium]|nr:MAG: hypothetical protein C6503_17540 [Candidatus Poribacteria bacterium]
MTINTLVKTVENLSRQIHVEIIDGVIRVRGNGYAVRGELKLLGFRWNRKAREWYCLIPETDLDRKDGTTG